MPVVKIGQEAFVLSPDGNVVRTVVAKLGDRGYQLLNGMADGDSHWFSYEEAVTAANARLIARQATVRKELRTLGRKRRELDAPSYRDHVMRAPYRVVDLWSPMYNEFERRQRTRSLKNICAPSEYPAVGQFVYTYITPSTRPLYDGLGLYRPHARFVLETAVTSVCFCPNKPLRCTFSTAFVVNEFYLTRKEAEDKLLNLPSTEVLEHAPFVSHEEEAAVLKKMEEEDDVPF